MSRRQKIKHMTPDELKSKLYAHFQKTGSLDHLKAQLRGQLVSELFKVADNIDPNPLPTATDVEKYLLPLQVCNWLIYDHLSRQDYQYSLSTFVTEAHLPNPEKLLTAGDILGLLGLTSSSSEFHNISKLYTENNEMECLNSLLLSIMKALFNIPNKDSINQTYNQNSEINSTLRKVADNLHESSNADNKDVSCDISFQNQLLKAKNMSMDKSFLSNDVQSAESSFHEQLQSVKKENEREIQKLRHKLLEELENLHSQEHKMQIELELEKTELRREHSKLLKEREILKEKQILLEKEIANKFEQKMRDANEDFASKLHFKDKEIEGVKSKLLEKEQKLIQVEAELSSQRDNCNLMKREVDEVRHMYKIIQDKYATVLDENTNLLKKFEDMADYSILKDELSSKSKEVLKLQNEIKDIHQKSEIERKKYVETVRNLEDNINIKEPQLIQAQRELEFTQNIFSSKEAKWNNEKRKLEQELTEFKVLYEQVIQRVEEQRGDIQDLHKTIYILNYKVNNNVANISNPEPLKSYKSYQRTSEITMKNKPQGLFTKRNLPSQHSSEIYKDTSLKFISDAKNRFGKLNQEENAIQEKYSYIFSALPKTKQIELTYGDNFSSIHKNNFENYELPSLKDIPLSSGFNFGNYSVNKMINSKSPYTFTNVKRMVSRSLFPSLNINSNFNKDLDLLDMYSKEQNMTTKIFKDISRESNAYNETVPKQLEVSQSKEESVNKNISSNFEKSSNSQNAGHSNNQNNGAAPTVEQKEIEKSSAENIFFISPNAKEYASSQRDEIAELPSVKSKHSKLQKEVLNSDASVSEEILSTISNKSNSSLHDESSNKLFINLDAAWKQRTSLPSLQQNISKITIKETIENVSELRDLQNIEATEKEHILQATKNDTARESNSFVRNPTTSKSPLEQNTPQDSTKFVETEHSNANTLKEKANTTLFQSSTSAFNKVFSTLQNISHDDKISTVDNVNKSKENLDQNMTIKTSTVSEIPEQKLDSSNTVQNTIISPTAKESELDLKQYESSNISKPSNTDDIEEDNLVNVAKSSEKLGNADSLSELSEVHLSCGSEPEQQKEDSDAW